MGQRGKGAKPKLSVVNTEQGNFGFAQDEVSSLRSVLPWEEPGLSRVERVGAFLEDLPITQGSLTGTNLVLRDWQWEFLEAVYAEDETGRRPVRTAVLSMARKNGKTQLVAGLGLCHLLGPEAENRGEVYAAANDKTQSGKTFAEMVAILDEHPELDARVNVVKFSKRIEVLSGEGKGSIFAALSADASTKQGLSPSFTIDDQLGTAPKRDLYEALDTAMGARDNPLLCVISTQAATDHAVMSELIDYGKKINGGDVTDDSFHLTFYGADMDDDPWTEETWLKANPALGDFRSLDDVRRQAAQAKRMPAAEQGFRNLILNQRVDAHVRFLAKAEWDANGGAVDYDALAGRECWGGAFAATLATRGDILALVDHDPARVLARTKSGTLRLSEDTRGLAFDLDVPDTQAGRDVLALAERGDLGGMSFGFNATDDNVTGNRRELRAVDLYEVSVVAAFPAYADTVVNARSKSGAYPDLAHAQRTLKILELLT